MSAATLICRQVLAVAANLSQTIRTVSTCSPLNNSYKQWPQEKVRRVGRSPPFSKGQGGKRSRIAYDKRYPMSGKDVNNTTEGLDRGGNKYMPAMIGEERAQLNPAVLKYYDYAKDREITEVIPEMIPEFVVPDLEGFKLKPYVSYRMGSEVCQSEPHTARELFEATYQQNIKVNKS